MKEKEFQIVSDRLGYVVIRKREGASSQKLEAEVEAKKLTGQADGSRQVVLQVI